MRIAAEFMAQARPCLHPIIIMDSSSADSSHHQFAVEVFDQITRELDRPSLLNFARAASFTYHIAARIVYRKIVLSPQTRQSTVIAMLRTLRRNPALQSYVVHLELAWKGLDGESGPIASKLSPVLACLPNLEHLSISRAISFFVWAFDEINIPSLRELHIWSAVGQLPAQFLHRHRHLRRVTLPPDIPHSKAGGGFPSRGLEELESLAVFEAKTIQDVFKLNTIDSPPQYRNLKRIDIAGNNTMDDKSYQLDTIHLPMLSRVNNLERAQTAVLKIFSNAVRARVTRFGMHLCIDDVYPDDVSGLQLLITHALAGYPHVHTLDLFCRCRVGKGCTKTLRDADSIGPKLFDKLANLDSLRMITLPGLAFTRQTSSDAYRCRPLSKEDGAPSFPWHLMARP